jgi:hypothetical protein
MTRKISRRGLLGAALAAMPSAALAQNTLLNEGRSLLGNVPSGGSGGGGGASGATGTSLSQSQIGAGLKQALQVAARKVTAQLGQTNGYNGDPAIRIPLPDPLQKVEAPLKDVGASGMLDDLQTKMNRAAEQAAPKALNIFTTAASNMSIGDAKSILTGPQDAATQYFKKTTSASLTTSFRPIVNNALSSVGAVQALNGVQSKAASLPFGAGKEAGGFNLTDFTVGKALDGLFHYMAVEEAAIRTDPAARTTALLKQVFG